MRRIALILFLTCATAVRGQEAILLPPTADAPPPLDMTLPPLFPPLLDSRTIGAPLPPLAKLWCGGLELGLNGAQGNSENFKLRCASHMKRENPQTIMKMDWLYTLAMQNSTRSENRGLMNGRHEWLLPRTRWSVFVSSTGEMDEFKAYDMRMAMHSGLGFNFIKNGQTLLKGRLGGGGSHEMGGPADRMQWEALAGVDFEHRFNKRYKLISSADYFPEFENMTEFRLQAKLSLEVLIDPLLNLSLKTGVLDRYDSTPEGKKPNDVEYFAVLLWKF